MATEFISIAMALNTKAFGKTISKLDTVNRPGLMAANMRACTKMARNMDSASTNGQTEAPTRAVGSTTKSKAKASIPGLMAESTTANGYKIRCMGPVSTAGKTAVATRAITSTIRSMDMGSIPGSMAASTRVTGKTARDKVKESISCLRGSVAKESGTRINGLDGLLRRRKLHRIILVKSKSD